MLFLVIFKEKSILTVILFFLLAEIGEKKNQNKAKNPEVLTR